MTIVAGPKVVEDGLVLSYDFANKKSFSANVHPGSTNIYDWYVGIRGNAGAAQSNISKDTIESPVGNTPLRMDVTGSDPHISSYNGLQWNLDEATSGDTWTVSVYAKASTNTTCQIFIFGANSSGQYIEAPAGARNITTEWQRISFTHTFANSNTVYIQSRLDGPDTQAGGNAVGQTIWFDGWQVERGSTATKFSPFYSDGNILDLSGKGNVGNLVNSPAFSEDNYGALVFDGSNDYIDFGSQITMSRSGSTCEFWVNKSSTSRMSFLTYLSSSVVSHVEFSSEGTITETKNNCNVFNSPIFTFNANEWYHIVFKFESNRSYWYINGEFIGETTDYGLDNCQTNPRVEATELLDDFDFRYIGLNTRYSGTYYGKLAIFKVYDRALTPIEIKQNFEATRGRFGI